MLTILAGCAGDETSGCAYAPWTSYNGLPLSRLPDETAYLFQTAHKAYDADGAPNAYHPDNSGLDDNANAGWPNTAWWPSVLVPDPGDPSTPYLQPDGPFAGYFVAQTTLSDPDLPETDPRKYVDASTVPYLVFPGSFAAMTGTGRFGDLGVAVNRATGNSSAFIVADQGPASADLGEMSVALAEALGGSNVNPRNGAGGPDGEILYIVCPRSAEQRDRAWPLDAASLDAQAQALLAAAGGAEAALACR